MQVPTRWSVRELEYNRNDPLLHLHKLRARSALLPTVCALLVVHLQVPQNPEADQFVFVQGVSVHHGRPGDSVHPGLHPIEKHPVHFDQVHALRRKQKL